MPNLAEPVDLRKLIEIFYNPIEQLGQFRRCDSADELPDTAGQLLNHSGHMTVTVESFYGCPVDVRVAKSRFGIPEMPGDEVASRTAPAERWYAREITLHRSCDNVPVQYGIVRLRYDLLASDVWNEIQSEQIPLGRALIQHNVLREVELCDLWEIRCGTPMARLLELETESRVYGRTARIFCDRQPAIDLLEIVTSRAQN